MGWWSLTPARGSASSFGVSGAPALLWMLAATACVDPRVDYESFVERPFARGDAAPPSRSEVLCGQLLAADLDGTYFASCLPIDLMAPFALAVNQTVRRSADGTTASLELSFTVLETGATDISQTTGPLYELPKTTISAACVFDQPIGDLTLPKDANLTGRDILGENFRLRGRLLSETRSCALVSGRVPLLQLELNKPEDVCVFVRRDAGQPLPELAVPGDYGCDPTGLPPIGP